MNKKKIVFGKITPVRETYTLNGFGSEEIGVTNRYLTKNGTPWIYVMGEIHYSRIPRKDWNRELRKMKEGGIDIAASYVFWIHHEEDEGVFKFTDNRDIKAFAQACAEEGLYFFLRIGPWAHGEARNGGFPDWLNDKCAGKTRDVVEPYMGYVKRLFEKIYEQLKESANIIGIQIENEMTFRPEYMRSLKHMVQSIGFTAPLWTATGWGDAKLPDGEMLPMSGAYPEAPWTQHTDPLPPNENWLFSNVHSDDRIGNDTIKQERSAAESDPSAALYPFLTCETGGGNQITFHRRPLISAREILSIVICELGSGLNGLGYYMYHGGINPVGKTYMQESREAGYPNDCPVISYDFQSPLGDCGQFRESYHLLGNIHRFIHSFGKYLAPMETSLPDLLPESPDDTNTPRAALRTNGKNGFLFVNNFVRLADMSAYDANVSVRLNTETLNLSVHIPANFSCILPINLNIGNTMFKYITALPVAVEKNILTLVPYEGIEPIAYLTDGSFVKLNSQTEIGDAVLKLENSHIYYKTTGTTLEINKCPENTMPFEVFRHLNFADETIEYSVCFDETTKYLLIQTGGLAAAAFADGKLISDWYPCGDIWVVDVREIRERKVILKIQPCSPSMAEKIYIESDTVYANSIPEVRAVSDDNIRI